MGKLGELYAMLPGWGQGLLVAVEGGIVGFLIQLASDPEPLCFSRTCLRHFAGAVGGVVVMSLRNWVKQSPLAREIWTPEQRAKINGAKDAQAPKA